MTAAFVVTMKRCARGDHDVQADLEHFHRSGKSPDGLHSWCKVCMVAYSRARYVHKKPAKDAAP